MPSDKAIFEFSKKNLSQSFLHINSQFPNFAGKNLAVAFSGGNDSVALLHAMSQLQRARLFPFQNQDKLMAIHVNHGLHAESDKWMHWCENFCKKEAIPFKAVKVEVKRRGNLEKNARVARYSAIAKALDANTLLVTGHHSDDQEITFLMRIFRGTSLKGLRGIFPFSQAFGLEIVRPVLSYGKDALRNYNVLYQLQWLEDPSNQDMMVERNAIKQSIHPIIKEKFPKFSRSAANTLEVLRGQFDILQEVAEQDTANLWEQSPYSVCCLKAKELCALSQARQKNLFAYLAERYNFHISDKLLQDTVQKLSNYALHPSINYIVNSSYKTKDETGDTGGRLCLQIYRDHLHLYTVPKDTEEEEYCTPITADKGRLKIASGILSWNGVQQDSAMNVCVMPLSALKRFHWPHRGTVAKKNIVQELGIPTWIRKHYPIIAKKHLSVDENGDQNRLNLPKWQLVAIPNFIDIDGQWNFQMAEQTA